MTEKRYVIIETGSDGAVIRAVSSAWDKTAEEAEAEADRLNVTDLDKYVRRFRVLSVDCQEER